LSKGPQRKESKFIAALEKRAETSKSSLILAADLDYRENTKDLLRDAKEIIAATRDYLSAVKLNLHLIIPLSLSQLAELNDFILSSGLQSIADLKLNDIDNTNRVATGYLWKAGFSAVIVNPFAGFENGLDVVFQRAGELGKGVITLAYMSHKGANEGFGLELANGRTMFDLFLERALSWGADGVVLGSTRPEKIAQAKAVLKNNTKILCPGSGAQGGDPAEALRAGADYIILGRSILNSSDPREAIRQAYLKMSAKAKQS
jgi:orotidine-5'-phosphate decarboxylase